MAIFNPSFIQIISGVTPGLVQHLWSSSVHHRLTTTWRKFCTTATTCSVISGASTAYTSPTSDKSGVKKCYSLLEHTWTVLGHFLFTQIYWGFFSVPKAAKLKFYNCPKSHWYWLSVVNKIIGWQTYLHPRQNTLRDISGSSFALSLLGKKKKKYPLVCTALFPHLKTFLSATDMPH